MRLGASSEKRAGGSVSPRRVWLCVRSFIFETRFQQLQVIIAGREDLQEAILDLTEGLGAEVIYDAVAGPGLEELVWATKRSGHVIVYGHLGAMEYKSLLPLGACFLRAINVHGSFRVFDFTGHPRLGLQAKPEAIDRAKKFISDGLASGLFSAKIDRVFVGLDEYAAAHRYIETNDQIGKIAVALSNYPNRVIKKPPSEA